jgi:hypothetical protein
VPEASLRYFYEKKITDISELNSTMAKNEIGPLRSEAADDEAAMSIKREDLDAGRIDLSDVTTGKRLPPIRAKSCAMISWLR